MSATLLAILLYVLVQLGIGVYISSRIATEDDYMIASRKFGCGMAIYAEGVYALVEEASAFGSAGIFVIVVFGLFTRWGGPYSALAALVGGVSVWVAGAYRIESAYPFLTSLLAAGVCYGVAAVIDHQIGPVPAAGVHTARKYAGHE